MPKAVSSVPNNDEVFAPAGIVIGRADRIQKELSSSVDQNRQVLAVIPGRVIDALAMIGIGFVQGGDLGQIGLDIVHVA